MALTASVVLGSEQVLESVEDVLSDSYGRDPLGPEGEAFVAGLDEIIAKWRVKHAARAERRAKWQAGVA